MIRGVFFDLGGTLRICDENPPYQRHAAERMAELAGWDDPDALQAHINKRYETYRDWALTENRESGDFELWQKWLLPELGEERNEAICHEMTYQYRQVKGLRRMADGGLETLAALKMRGYRLGIISNLIGEEEIYLWLKQDGLEDMFDSVTLSSICLIRKPDPEIYRIACRDIGLEPSECASIADNLGRDITGAIEVGIGANILCISPEKLAKKVITDENRPDYIVHSLPEVLDLPILQGGEPA